MPLRLLFSLLSLAALPAMALEWKAETLSFTTAPFQTTQEAVFEFRNTGPKPVALLDLETDCGCMEAVADQKVYAPGAAGTIKALFTIGDRLGLYERHITVRTDETGPAMRLLVKIEVPEIVTLTPRSVAWNLNEPATEKSVDVQCAPNVEIIFTNVQPTTGTFQARLETIEAGRHYRVYLRPPETSAPTNAAFRITGHEKSGRPIVVSAYGNVR
jgi:hypothetical protein